MGGRPAGPIRSKRAITPRLCATRHSSSEPNALKPLEQAGLIRSRKVARNVFYSVDAGGMGETIAFLLNDCCMEHPEVLACCRHGRSVAAPVIAAPDQMQDQSPGMVKT